MQKAAATGRLTERFLTRREGWIENISVFSLTVKVGLSKFRFLKCGDHSTRCAETAQEREVLSLSWISPRFFTPRYRWLAMFQLSQRQARNLAASRCLLSVFEP